MTADDQGRARFGRAPNAWGATHHASAPDRTRLTHAMAQLSSDYRALLHRAYYYGWTTQQIAADLGIAEGTVKTQLHYALRTLQGTLRDMGVVL